MKEDAKQTFWRLLFKALNFNYLKIEIQTDTRQDGQLVDTVVSHAVEVKNVVAVVQIRDAGHSFQLRIF